MPGATRRRHHAVWRSSRARAFSRRGGEPQRERLPLFHEPGHPLLRLLARLGDLAGLLPISVEIRIGERQPDLLLARFELLDLRFHRAEADLDGLDLAVESLVGSLAVYRFLL